MAACDTSFVWLTSINMIKGLIVLSAINNLDLIDPLYLNNYRVAIQTHNLQCVICS